MVSKNDADEEDKRNSQTNEDHQGSKTSSGLPERSPGETVPGFLKKN